MKRPPGAQTAARGGTDEGGTEDGGTEDGGSGEPEPVDDSEEGCAGCATSGSSSTFWLLLALPALVRRRS